MKKYLALPFLLLALVGCGNNDAEEDYAACNDEYASDLECTEDEFKDYLLLKYEDEAEIIGGLEDATAETQAKVMKEIDDKIEVIFGE